MLNDSQIHELIARLVVVVSDEQCPITRKWRMATNRAFSINVDRGVAKPVHEEKSTRWFLIW
jgi:hypothetical protein